MSDWIERGCVLGCSGIKGEYRIVVEDDTREAWQDAIDFRLDTRGIDDLIAVLQELRSVKFDEHST